MIGGLKECGTFAGEKKGTFFLVIRFFTYTLYFKAYTGIFYPVPTHQKWLPIRQNPDAYSFSDQLLPVGRKGSFGKAIVNYS